jgi:hypothetical protein
LWTYLFLYSLDLRAKRGILIVSMKQTRRILMVAFVATALAADHVAAAAPSLRPIVAETARRLAGRLVVTFRRTVPSIRFQPFRADERPADQRPTFAAIDAGIGHRSACSPFQFRLPPPAL